MNAIPMTAENRYRWCMNERRDQTADRDAPEEPQRASVPFVTDAEMTQRLGVPEKVARETIRMLDRDPRSGFPKNQPLWGNRRYWPAVRAWFDHVYGFRPSKK